MKGKPIVGIGGRVALLAGVVTLGVVLALAPEAFAWGRGGFGARRFGGAPEGASGAYQAGGSGSPSSGTGQTYIYPSKSQSPQREQNDKAQCYTWAVQQSGFDPANPRVPSGPAPAPSAPRGGMFRGAAGGAALGAVGGAIGGDAGKGAAIGAGTGALFGGMRRRRQQEQQQYEEQTYLEQRQNALNRGRSNFNRAFGACMTGRGYTVGG